MFLNNNTGEINCKVVYEGPGLGGKTTNLQFLYTTFKELGRAEQLISLATETDRTLFTDFAPEDPEPVVFLPAPGPEIRAAFDRHYREVDQVPQGFAQAQPSNKVRLDFGMVGRWKLRIHVYTVPGPVFYDESRRLLLKGLSGVVFVVDSQKERLEANLESLEGLKNNLKSWGYDPESVPMVFQYNKRDLKNCLGTRQLQKLLNPRLLPWFEAVAAMGIGVLDSFNALVKLIRADLEKQLPKS